MSSGFGCKGYDERVGVLVAQLGTPQAPTGKALRPYLRQFLSDRRVIERNRLLWWFVLHGIVLRTRPRRSARLYKRIWRSEGSPLLHLSELQRAGLEGGLRQLNSSIVVELGMRYGEPSLPRALNRLQDAGCSRILLLPMYPQYAGATTASTYDAVFEHVVKARWVPTLRVVAPFFRHRRYIDALATVIRESYSKAEKRPQKLVLSYHGIPEAYVNAGDPYCCMCSETTKALTAALGFEAEHVIHTYQSRFGRDPWLVPYTDVTLRSLAEEGVKHVAVACPGFTTDCLETLDELGHEGRDLFREHGGETFELVPCLNDHPAWIEAMTEIVCEELGSWLRVASPNLVSDCPIDVAKAAGMKP